MSNYYTNFIDPGNSGGSVPTPDTSIPFVPRKTVYPCRFCATTFGTDGLRVQHEWNEHPSKNPQLYIRGKAVGSTRLTISTKLSPEDIEFTNCERLTINGYEVHLDDASQLLSSKEKHFFDVTAINQNISRVFKVDVDIANPAELEQVDSLFWLILNREDFTEELITQFVRSCSDFASTRDYVDGIIKYLQGIMAKDGKAQVLIFEDFDKRFSQARTKLQPFDTPLSRAIQSVIDFNQNQFDANGLECVPFLAQAMALFLNNDLIRTEVIPQRNSKKLPVDRITAFLLDEVIDQFDCHSVESIQELMITFPKGNVSLNDRKKLQFLLLKKAYNSRHFELLTSLKKRLSSDDAFNLNFIEDTGHE
ncbi:hypothetical protein [Vibrio vulnificus]|uniref:hypothetical protein n=1 Tax=Vibrio vulnificus TaxID=672 RepID=UPI00102D1237|nr:hypothetical protein [Vibrio vulnificus]RZR39857.1 hypothetical protein D8T58_22390 [Vibrio vulnificus]